MNRSLLFIAAALFLWGFGEGLFFNFVPIYLDLQFLLSKSEIGLILGMFGFFSAVTHIPAGRLADRFGRKPLLVLAWVVGLVSTVLMGIGQSLPLFLTGLFMYGLTAFVSSPLSSYMTAARGSLSVGTVLSLTTATFGMGMVLGPVSGGWIGDHYGMRTSFLVAAGIFIFSNACMYFIESQPIDHHDPDAPPTKLNGNRKFMSLIMVLTFAIFAMYLAMPMTPNFLESVRGLSLSESGWIFTAGALGNSLMAIAFSRANPRKGYLAAQGLVALFAVLIWKGSALPVFMLGYFVLGGFRAARPMSLALARDLVHDSQMGLTYGVMETVSSIITIITPPIAGLIFEVNPFILYPISIALIAVSILFGFFRLPSKEAYA